MKLFISADIEGTAGIVSWKETAPGDQYGYFAGQRSITGSTRRLTGLLSIPGP